MQRLLNQVPINNIISSPHKPLLVVSHSTCSPRSSSPHVHSFVSSLGTAVINNNPPRAQEHACEFLCLLFLQAHRETVLSHFTTDGMLSQHNHSDSFCLKCLAFYQSMKSKVGLMAAKEVGMRINLNVDGCVIVAAPVHAPSRAPLLLPLLLSHNLPLPCIH